MAPKRKAGAGHLLPNKEDGVPRDAMRVQQLLSAMDVERCEPRVTQQLLELMHRTISETLQDAVHYTEHAGRSEITVEDTRLATQAAAHNGDLRRRPAPSLLREMAAVCNRKQLQGQRKRLNKPVSLPHPSHTFIHEGRTRNWQVVVPQRARQLEEALPRYVPAPVNECSVKLAASSAPRIPIRLGVQAAAAEAPAEAALPAHNLQAVLTGMQTVPAVDFDDDMWEQPAETSQL